MRAAARIKFTHAFLPVYRPLFPRLMAPSSLHTGSFLPIYQNILPSLPVPFPLYGDDFGDRGDALCINFLCIKYGGLKNFFYLCSRVTIRDE